MMNTTQRNFILTVPRIPGESQREHRWRIRDLNDDKRPVKRPDAFQDLANLLKKQAGRVMVDVTECPALTLPAHLSRLDDLRDIINLAMRDELVPPAETQLSGKQLLYAATLADFLACLEITRKEHRAPAFVNQRDQQLEKIWHGIELIAGMVAAERGVAMPEQLKNNEAENER